MEYLLPQGDKLTLFLNSKSSDRLGSNALLQPGLADVDLLSYGLGIFQERFDYRFNPQWPFDRCGRKYRTQDHLTSRVRTSGDTTGSKHDPI
ncbi:MAG: hypothetical protein R2818_06575 [Flavobacteriales bacterium]